MAAKKLDLQVRAKVLRLLSEGIPPTVVARRFEVSTRLIRDIRKAGAAGAVAK